MGQLFRRAANSTTHRAFRVFSACGNGVNCVQNHAVSCKAWLLGCCSSVLHSQTLNCAAFCKCVQWSPGTPTLSLPCSFGFLYFDESSWSFSINCHLFSNHLKLRCVPIVHFAAFVCAFVHFRWDTYLRNFVFCFICKWQIDGICNFTQMNSLPQGSWASVGQLICLNFTYRYKWTHLIAHFKCVWMVKLNCLSDVPINGALF